MAKALATPIDSPPSFGFEPLFAWSVLLAQNLLRLQQLQLEACLTWQKALADTGQACYDEWACRFAGGAPIDG
jgi:hypothetical protein